MDSVNRTLYIPLYGKARVSKLGVILEDKTAERIWTENAVPLGRRSKSKWLAYFMAMRAKVFDDWVREMLALCPGAIVLHVGCGLDSRVHRVGASGTQWYDVDLPEVIALRRSCTECMNTSGLLPGEVVRLPRGRPMIPPHLPGGAVEDRVEELRRKGAGVL